MTRALVIALAALLAFRIAGAEAKSKEHYPNEGGQYVGGKGSSHKGGKYRNRRTHDHAKHKRTA
jgi:hypothetical protein